MDSGMVWILLVTGYNIADLPHASHGYKVWKQRSLIGYGWMAHLIKGRCYLKPFVRYFLTEQQHMDEKLLRSIYFSTMPRWMQERSSSIPCGNRQVREENSKLLLTSLETLTPQHETWKIQEKDLLLNRAGNCLNIACLMNCIIIMQNKHHY